MSNKKTSVKQAVDRIINEQIEAGRINMAQFLNPSQWGRANDQAMMIQTLTQLSHYTSEPVREETVLRYVRQYKAKARQLIK